MASSSTYAFFHCHYAFQKFPFFCVTLCVLHALPNATESHSADWKRSFQATGRQHRGCIIPQAVTHSLVLLKMGEIITRNMLSWLDLLINRYLLHLFGCLYYLFHKILGAFAKLPKATNSFVMFVRLYVHPQKQLSSSELDVHEIWYLSIFWRSFENIQV